MYDFWYYYNYKWNSISFITMYPTLSISDKNVKKYFLLPDYIHNFSGSIYINIRRHSKLSFFSFNYDDSFWQKKSFANTLSSIFHCPPSILLKLSTIFLGDLTWRRRWWWFDPSVTFLYEKTCRCCCPYGSSPISSSTISFNRWWKYNDILSGKGFLFFQKY